MLGGSSILHYDKNKDKLGIIVDGEKEHLFDIEISNESYSSSDQLNTFLEINGEKYGHIISPRTYYPSKNKKIGLVAETAFIADILSTGLYNQNGENFKKILKDLSKEIKIEAFLIDENNKIYFSDNFEKYIEK